MHCAEERTEIVHRFVLYLFPVGGLVIIHRCFVGRQLHVFTHFNVEEGDRLAFKLVFEG